MSFTAIIEMLGVIAGGLTAIGAIGMVLNKWGIQPVRRGITGVKEAINDISTLKTNMNTVVKELNYNDGSTLRDMVLEIYTRISMNENFDKVMANALNYGVFHTAPDGAWTWANLFLQRIIDVQKDQLYGFNWKNHIHPIHREQVSIEWHNSMSEERDFSMEITIQTAQGRSIDCKMNAYLIRNNKNENLGYIGTIFPIER